ncbi:MAG: cytochrome c biogenesis protein CcdA [Erysipelotrichaceae bacterium]
MNILIVFLAGITSFFSPCVYPLLLVYFSVFLGENYEQMSIRSRRIKLLISTLLFIIGVSLVFIILVIGMSELTSLFNGKYLRYIFCAFIILMGLNQLDIIKLNIKGKQFNFSNLKINHYVKMLLMGIGFSIGFTPCVGPILSSIILYSSLNQELAYSLFLLIFYIIGFALPFVIISLVFDLIKTHLKKFNRYLPYMHYLSGCLLVLLGILLMVGYL